MNNLEIKECKKCNGYVPRFQSLQYKYCPYCGTELTAKEIKPEKDNRELYLAEFEIKLNCPFYVDGGWDDDDLYLEIQEMMKFMDYGGLPDEASEKMKELWEDGKFKLKKISTISDVNINMLNDVIPYRSDMEDDETCEDIILRKIQEGKNVRDYPGR